MQEVVDGFSVRSSTPFNETLDMDAFIRRIEGDLSFLDDETREGLLPATGDRFLSQLSEEHPPRLLRVHAEGEEIKGLVRIDYSDNGFGCLAFLLEKDDAGRIRIVDWDDYATGTSISRFAVQMAEVAKPTPTSLGKLFDAVTATGSTRNSSSPS